MQHFFDISIAEKYGVNIAIFLSNMAFWIKKNQANNKHFHDGRYWTYNTMEAYTKLFPYWSFKQIRTLLNKLKSEGLVLIDNYNLTSYDRTQWYALTDLAHELLHLPICPNGQIDLTEKANRFDEKGKPIPDIKPDIKPDSKSFCKTDQKEANKQKHPWAAMKNEKAAIDESECHKRPIEKDSPANDLLKDVTSLHLVKNTHQPQEMRSTVKEWGPGHPDWERRHRKQKGA